VLRNTAVEFLKKKIARQPFGQFIQEVLYGKASTEVYGALKKIAPLRRVEIYKTELQEVFDVEEKQEVPGATEKPVGSESVAESSTQTA